MKKLEDLQNEGVFTIDASKFKRDSEAVIATQELLREKKGKVNTVVYQHASQNIQDGIYKTFHREYGAIFNLGEYLVMEVRN